jgi:hypothetical protein
MKVLDEKYSMLIVCILLCVIYRIYVYNICIYVYNGGSLHNNTPEKQNRHYCINICFVLLLTLHVSALILGHHQAYNDNNDAIQELRLESLYA